jgi:hypothetical protein
VEPRDVERSLKEMPHVVVINDTKKEKLWRKLRKLAVMNEERLRILSPSQDKNYKDTH